MQSELSLSEYLYKSWFYLDSTQSNVKTASLHSSVLCIACLLAELHSCAGSNAKINSWPTIPARPEWLKFSQLQLYHMFNLLWSPFFWNIGFSFIVHQSVCECGCLCHRLPRLHSVLGEHSRSVRHSSRSHEGLHDRQQRGRRGLVS